MKLLLPILCLLLINPLVLPQADENHFKPGEILKFLINYGPINGGFVESNLQLKEFEGKKVFHVSLLAKTIGFADKIYKVRDEYQSYFDLESLLPYKAIRDISEGRYKRYDHAFYYHKNLKVINNKNKEFKIPADARDVASVFFYIRNLNFAALKYDEIIKINTFFDNELLPFDMRYRGLVTIKTKLGTYRCIKLVPFVATGRVFEREDDMTIYLSDDFNRVPIRIEFKLKVGTVNCDLVEFSGLKNYSER